MLKATLLKASWLLVTALVLLLAPVHASWAQDVRTVDVRFPRGSSGTTLSDTITGYQTINYRIGVTAGQTMSVQLDTDNSSNDFNINAPGASAAAYNSSISGNSTNFRIPSSGNYIISVYLMRNAARRGESADFDLTLYVSGSAAQTPRPTTLPSGPVAPITVPSMDGGPDFWQVQGLGSDTLNVRSGPSTSNGIIGTVRNGDTLRNFGCTMSGGTRWCQISTPRGQQGWVAGQYLHESFGGPSTLPSVNPRPVAPRPQPQPLPVPYSPPQNQVSTSDMPRFCTGEASARYGVRPTEITVNGAINVGRNYITQGYFNTPDGRSTFFNCYFGADGSFQSVN